MMLPLNETMSQFVGFSTIVFISKNSESFGVFTSGHLGRKQKLTQPTHCHSFNFNTRCHKTMASLKRYLFLFFQANVPRR